MEAYFKEHPPTTIPHAAAMIEELTGIKRSPTQVGIFLKKLGLKRVGINLGVESGRALQYL